MTELATFGETMLRYSPPAGTRLESTGTLAVHIGGSESNVAVAASRLGRDAVWLSKLVDSPLGRRVDRTLRAQGVTTDVVWTDEGRQGTYYIEPGGTPRGTEVVYDRADSAVTTATAGELPVERVETADLFHTSGITPALSETLEGTTATLLSRAREAGTRTSFDVNYRSKLWTPEAARGALSGLLEQVDVLFVAERDAETVFGRTGHPEEIARGFREEYGHDAVVVTRGDEGALAVADGVHEQPTFDSETRDPVGTGDAFVGGVLAARLDGADLPDALGYGAATAALKRTIDGDLALVSPEEVEQVLEAGGPGISR